MKRLILVRHAKTEPMSDAGSDYSRKLKKRGHKDAAIVSQHLQQKGYTPDAIISSPATRALQTAEIFAETYDIDSSEIREAPFLYDGETTIGFLAGIASEAQAGEETLMVVGHNPDMAMLSMRLTNKEFFNFPTCAVTVINFSVNEWSDMQARSGRAEYFIYPKKLKEK
ncbi:histidine phosphatase family protein [Marinilabiliaceae bacterium ANBcel2]|nr:histidine phosphatase family protein [Marinilabiliaceae bacterium ANBcel2]